MATERIDIVVSERGSRTVKRNLQDIGDGAKKAAGEVDLMAAALKGLAALSLAALSAQVLAFGRDFTTVLAKISTNVDTATFSMAKLSEAALRQSTAFSSTPVEQAEALYDIISAGANTAEEAIDKLTAANKLAVGGITTVGVAADGLTSVLNAYGSKIESAEAAADAMFIAARDGKTTIDQLAAGLGNVAPIAASMGVSFDEVNAAIAALTKGGISTEQSITGLRAILSAIVKPSQEASKLAAQLGIDFSTAGLQARGLGGFMEYLTEKTKGSSDDLAVLMGGVEALVPALALTKTGAADFAQSLENMRTKAGAAEAAFNKMAQSPGFLIDKILARITEEATRLGVAILNALQPALKALADNMDLVVKTAYVFSAALLAAFAPAAIVAGINLITAAVVALTTVLLANPFTLIALAIAAATAAMYAFGDSFVVGSNGMTTLLDYARAAFSYISDAASATAEFFRSAWATVGDDVSTAISKVGETFKVMGGIILSLAKVVVNAYIGIWVGAYKSITAAWALFPSAMADFARMAANYLIDIVGGAVQGILNSVQSLLNFLGKGFTVVGADNPFANLIPDDIDKRLGQYKQKVTGAASDVGKIIKNEMTDAVKTDYLGAVVDAVGKRADEIAAKRIQDIENADKYGNMNRSTTPLVSPQLALPPSSGESHGGGGAGSKKKATEELTAAEKKYKSILEEIQGPEQEYQATLAAAGKLLAEGTINAEQYARAIRDVSIAAAEAAGGPINGLRAGLMSVQKDSVDMAKDVSDAVQNAFGGMEDALVDFVTTGKMNFGKLVDSILADIARLVIRYMVMQPIINALSGLFGGMSLGSSTGAIPIPTPRPSFATGGSFQVGGAGGVDSQLVQFMASPGERVSIARPGEATAPSRSTGPTSTTVNVYNNGQPVQAQAETKQNSDGSISIDVMLEQVEEKLAGRVAQGGSTLNKAFEGRYSLDAAKGIQR